VIQKKGWLILLSKEFNFAGEPEMQNLSYQLFLKIDIICKVCQCLLDFAGANSKYLFCVIEVGTIWCNEGAIAQSCP
jgi:hypothetical protein